MGFDMSVDALAFIRLTIQIEEFKLRQGASTDVATLPVFRSEELG
jgi:hypothetical protein